MSSSKHTPQTGDIYLSPNDPNEEHGDTYIILREGASYHNRTWDWVYLFMEGEEGGDYLQPSAGYYCVNEDMGDPESDTHDYIFVCNQDDVEDVTPLAIQSTNRLRALIDTWDMRQGNRSHALSNLPIYRDAYKWCADELRVLLDSEAYIVRTTVALACVYSDAGDWCETHTCVSNMCGSR